MENTEKNGDSFPPITITVTIPEQDVKALKRIRSYFDGKTQLEAFAGDVLERIIKQLPDLSNK